MKIALLLSDNREPFREYHKDQPWFGTAPEALLQGFMQLPEVEVHAITCTQRRMKSPEKLADNVFFHSLLVPKIGWLRTGYQGCIRAIRKKLKSIEPDIVHGQGTERECALGAAFSGFPNVVTVHGNMRLVARVLKSKPFSFHWLASHLEAFVLPRTNGVVCITNYTRDAVKNLTPKTWLIPNAVDASFFDIQPRSASPPIILCVANVDARKNQNSLIRALDNLPGPKDFILVFLGIARAEGAYGREFLKLVEARPWCRYRGFIDRESLKSYMATASGVILPSLEDNCPMVILEGMAAGVPVAASKVGGVPDLIRTQKTGMLFDPRDEKAMAMATIGLLSAEAHAKTALAREEAIQRFHPKIIARQHMDVYREVIATLPKQPRA